MSIVTIRRRGLAVALAASAAIAFGGCAAGEPKRITNDPYNLVLSYIDALNQRDEGKMRDLVNPGYDVGGEIDKRVAELDGKSLHYERMEFVGTGMRQTTSVELTMRSGSASDVATYTDTLPLSVSDGNWYIDMGKPK
jgi:hypothetical protein